MKKIIFPLAFILLGYSVFFFLFDKKKPQPVAVIKNDLPTDHSTPEKNYREDNFEESTENQFDSEPQGNKPVLPTTAERKYIGGDFKPIENPPENIVYENSVNPNWENLLIREFFDGEKPDGNIEIKRLESLVYIRGGSGLYVEKVSVTVTSPKEMAGTFYAFVNSGTGEIIHAWEGEEESTLEEAPQVSEESPPVEVDNAAMEIPESTIEEGLDFTEEELGSASVEDNFYPDYN